jgi:hypothetical protein
VKGNPAGFSEEVEVEMKSGGALGDVSVVKLAPIAPPFETSLSVMLTFAPRSMPVAGRSKRSKSA